LRGGKDRSDGKKRKKVSADTGYIKEKAG